MVWLAQASGRTPVNVTSTVRDRALAVVNRICTAVVSKTSPSETPKPVDDIVLNYRAALPEAGGDHVHEYHDQLDSGDGEIRLLVIEPAVVYSAKIVCRLQTARLGAGDCPQYDAVSYCWGGSLAKQPVELDKREEHFPVSAVRCIRNIRDRISRRCIWIDAICINQFDQQEKSHQVAIMRMIYQQASSVIVCLSTEAYSIRQSLSIKTAVTHLLEQWRQETKGGKDVRKIMFSSNNTPLSSRTDVPKGALPVSLQLLLQDPWFTRLWVVQEASLAPRGKVLVGGRKFDLMDILRAAAWLQHKMPDVSTGVRNAAMIWRYADREFGLYASGPTKSRWGHVIRLVRPGRAICACGMQSTSSETLVPTPRIPAQGAQNFEKDEADSDDLAKKNESYRWYDHDSKSQSSFLLTSLLRDFHLFAASNKHDRIYALLGLSMQQFSTEAIWQSLQPNYKDKSPTEVYRDATRAAIYEIAGLDILAIPLPFHTSDQGPTWVPKWDSNGTQADQPKSLPLFFRASAPDGFPVPDLLGGHPDALRSTGIGFAWVQSVSRCLVDRDFTSLPTAAELMETVVEPILDRAREAASTAAVKSRRVLWGEDLDRSISLTLVAGATYNGASAVRQETHRRDWKAFHGMCGGIRTRKCSGVENVDERICRFIATYRGDTRSCVLRYLEGMRRACANRRLFVTDDGRVGLGPQEMERGDRVCVLDGGNWPFLLRGVNGRWNFVGAAYIDGVMFGEIKHLEDQGYYEREWFDIW